MGDQLDNTQKESTVEQLLYTPEQAAAVLSVGRTTVYELMSSGRLAAVRIGRCRRITSAALLAYVDDLMKEAS